MVNIKLNIFLFCVVYLSAPITVLTEDSFLILTPHVWIWEFDQTILIDFPFGNLNRYSSLNLKLVKKDDSSVEFKETFKLTFKNNYGLVKFRLPDHIVDGTYNLTVNGLAKIPKTILKSHIETIEVRKHKTNSFHITTDKPVYKASENVKIRIVGIDAELKPLNNVKVSVLITDPSFNKLDQILDLKFKDGVIEDVSFQINERPQLGTWEIKVISEHGDEVTRPFYVKEYVLPKFDFEIETSSYLLKDKTSIEGSILAKYTYGSPVNGDAEIIAQVKSYYYTLDDTEKYINIESLKLKDGKVEFSSPLKINPGGFEVELNVTVTDEMSGEKVTKIKSVNLYDIELNLQQETYDFEPNSVNEFKLKLTYPDGRPYSEKNFTISPTLIYLNYEKYIPQDPFTTKTSIDGKASFKLDIPANITSLTIEVHLTNDPKQTTNCYLYKRADQISLILNGGGEVDLFRLEPVLSNPNNKVLKMNSNFKLKVIRQKSAESNWKEGSPCLDLKYLVISRSIIYDYGQTKFCPTIDNTFINLKLTPFHAPHSSLIVYLVDQDYKLHVSNYEIEIPEFYTNKLKFGFSKPTVEPGENVELKIKSTPNSKVSVCVIDQSVALMEKPNQITNDEIFSKMQSLRLTGYFQPIVNNDEDEPNNQARPGFNFRYGYWADAPAKFKLKLQGLVVMDDFKSLKPQYKNMTFMPLYESAPIGEIMNFGGASDAFNSKPAANRNNEPVTPVRSDFRESWIWQTVTADKNGEYSIKSVIPDTITSWIASGFSLSDKHGIAIGNQPNITVFKGFFVSMILPPSLIRGEILTLKVVVSNYLNTDLKDVSVSLLKTDDFKTDNNESIHEDLIKKITNLPSQTALSVTFNIQPVNIGLLSLTAKAVSSVAGDAEKRQIRVKAEGINNVKNVPMLIDMRDEESTKKFDLELKIPDNIVERSEFCSIKLTGDLLGSAFSNLDALITKPGGCGEQNMLGLTPNIYALRYLKALSSSQQSASNIQTLIKNSINNIKSGYQNQLNYMRDDGSYSAFGKSDKSGSSWLTAFVVKSFSQAKEFVDIIENSKIEKSVEWLINQQDTDGSFNEPGNVIHRDMQGGVKSNLTITAYIAIALLESNLSTQNVTQSAKRAISYLEYNLFSLNDLKEDENRYSLALITYALGLAKSKLAFTAFNKLNSISLTTTDSTQMFWSTGKSSNNNEPPSSSIEMTSYALLTYLLRDRLNESVSIVKWLNSKSNSLGTYSSTQNTILALQSLSEFGLKLMKKSGSSDNYNIVIDITATDDSNESIKKSFNINSRNSLMLQTWELDSCKYSNINLKLTGNGGVVSLQAIASYNLPVKMDNFNGLSIEQTTDKFDPSSYSVNVKTCVKYKSNDEPKTGMALVESYILGGYEVNKQELNNILLSENNSYLKLIETPNNENKVVFYLDKLENNNEVCIEWKMYRAYQVENIKPTAACVYDYYRPQMEACVMFDIYKFA